MLCLRTKLPTIAVGPQCWTTSAGNGGAVFNIFTGTVWSKTQYDCATIVMLLRGFAKGIPTKWLTDEMDLAYPSVLKRRHRIQEAVQNGERVGLVCRETGSARFQVCPDTTTTTLQEVVTEKTGEEALIYTDENRSYLWLEDDEEPRERRAINHSTGWPTGTGMEFGKCT